MCAARAGIAKANTLPVHGSLLADAYPIAGRARVYAVHNLANPVGLLIGPVLAGAAGERTRIAFRPKRFTLFPAA